jgi:dipicolinate synthase subunit A
MDVNLQRAAYYVVDCADKRNEYLSDSLKADGYRVILFNDNDSETKYADTVRHIFLFAPSRIVDEPLLNRLPRNSTAFCLNFEKKCLRIFKQKKITVHKYFDDELLAMKNAYLTAEGALGIIIANTDRSVKDMRTLILGGGRVGKSVAKLLHDNRSSVFVATIDHVEYAFASIFSDGVYFFDEFYRDLSGFDLIVNTVPALVLSEDELKKVKKDCFLLDLASLPGGIDFNAAKFFGLNAVHALGIPGKYAPHSAGMSVKESVFRILSKDKNKEVTPL